MFIVVFANAQTPEQVKQIRLSYDLEALQKLQDKYITEEIKDQKEVATYIKKNKISNTIEKPDGSVSTLVRIAADGSPIYYGIDNTNCAASTRTDYLNTGGGLGLNLNGEGFVVRVWDGAPVLETHVEFGGRAQAMDGTTIATNSFHSTHVLGTIISAGTNSVNSKGMAPAATAKTYDFVNDKSEVVNELLQRNAYF